MSNNRKNILVYCDFGCTTGFGNLAKEIINGLMVKYQKHKFIIYAINNFEKEIYQYAENVTVVPAHLKAFNKTDFFYRDGMLKHLFENDIDLFFMIHDIEMASSIHTELVKINHIKKDQRRLRFKSIFYFPVDSIPLAEHVRTLTFFDELITYTEYGKKVISTMSPLLSSKIKVISHGVDAETYYPLPKRKSNELRRKYFPNKSYIIGCVNRNSARKDISTLLMAFSELKHKTNDSGLALYLHMNPVDHDGPNLYNICELSDLRVGYDVFFPEHVFTDISFSENKGVAEEKLNEVYNTLDLFVSTSTAEGWGLTVTEAMAAGTLVLCPLHTSLAEISGDSTRALTIDKFEQIVFSNDGDKIRYKVPNLILADRLEELHNSYIKHPDSYETLKDDITHSARKYAMSIPWGKINMKFALIFDKYL